MKVAKDELANLSDSLKSDRPNGTDGTAGCYATLEHSAATLDKEHIHEMANR